MQGADPAHFSGEDVHSFAQVADIPDLDEAVLVTRGHGDAVRGPVAGEAVVFVAGQAGEEVACFGVGDEGPWIVADVDAETAVWAGSGAVDEGVPFAGVDKLGRVAVENADVGVVVAESGVRDAAAAVGKCVDVVYSGAEAGIVYDPSYIRVVASI